MRRFKTTGEAALRLRAAGAVQMSALRRGLLVLVALSVPFAAAWVLHAPADSAPPEKPFRFIQVATPVQAGTGAR